MKNSKILKSILLSFSFIVGIFLLTGAKLNAASTDLYYSNKVLADSYNSDGTVVLKSTIDVYAHNNGAGYRIDNSQLRISKVIVTNGSVSKEYSTGDVGYNNADKIINVIASGTGVSDGHGTLPGSQLDKIVLKIGSMGLTDASNSITVKIEFQQNNKILWIDNWESYGTTINVKKGGSAASNPVTLYKTDTTFANGQLKITGVSLSSNCTYKSNGSDENCYNINNFNNNAALNLTVSLNYNITGSIYACYSTASSSCFGLAYNNSREQTINLKTIENFLKLDVSGNTYTFDKFKVANDTKDKYGSSITTTSINNPNSLSAKFVLDTKAPTVSSAGVANENESSLYDVGEINPKINFSEYVSLNVTSFVYTMGEETKTVTCSSCVSTGTSYTGGHYVSGNGIIKLSGFDMTITDKYGNTTTYTVDNSSALCTANNKVTLVSSLDKIEIEKSYYYNTETIKFIVTLVDGVETTDFSLINIKFSDSTSATLQFAVENQKTVLNYLVDESIKSIKELNFYKNVDGNNELVYTQEINIVLNTYLDLGLNNTQISNNEDSTIDIYKGSLPITLGTISIPNGNIVLESLTCLVSGDNNENASCSYVSKTDGEVSITIPRGTLLLSDGQKNDEEIFTLIVNNRAPVVQISENAAKLAKYESTTYYNSATDVVNFSLSDGYGEGCLYYKFNDQIEYAKVCETSGTIELPQEAGTYTLSYYSSDGTNDSEEITYTTTSFTYRGSFEKGDIEVFVNDIDVTNIKNTNINSSLSYNHIVVNYQGALGIDLLNSFDLNVVNKSSTLVDSSNEALHTFTLTSSDLANINDVVNLTLMLTDKLGNFLIYELEVNVDTIAPTFDDITVNTSESNDVYKVTIYGFGENSVYAKVDGIRVDLDSNNSFTLEKEKYSIVLVDEAGNKSEKVFTTIAPGIELFLVNNGTYDVKYEINISPFDSSIHQIEEYKYLVFDYMANVSEDNLEVARANVCTTGRKVNCYVEGRFSASNSLITQTFNKGYSYFIQVKINNVLANDKLTNTLPRLDIMVADTSAPVGGFLDDDINPDYISSVSSYQFTFSFVASDTNLNTKYYYLIVKSSINSKMSVSNFYSLYQNCYGATASSNSCGIRGENQYRQEISEGTYLGQVIVEANNNTKRRLENNVKYSLYVLLTDNSDNSTLFKVREFTNITNSSVIEYLDDTNTYQKLEHEESAITINTTKVRISMYQGIEIQSVKINDVSRTCHKTSGCSYDLGVGQHVVEVTDALGNIKTVTIFSATANNPGVYVYYDYNGEYFRILDNGFAYNTTNAGKVYIKVVDNNLSMVRVVMNTTSIYQTGDSIFDSISNVNNTYGMSLLDIMNAHNGSEYSGDITISAINETGGETSITLIVDNEAPEFTTYPAGNKINLLGNLYDLTFNEGKFAISFNYQRDITYSYLISALSLKVDSIEFADICTSNRLSFTINGSDFSNFDESISIGNSEIVLNYFDNAGNIAQPLTIVITVTDNENPTITLNEALTSVELNTDVTLSQVFIEDNHDSNEDLTLTVKINNAEIDYTSYKFLAVGEYQVTYRVSDSSNNYTEIVQNISVKDTTAPTLKQDTIANYEIGHNKELVFDLPIFVDSDPMLSQYLPHQIKVLDLNENQLDDTMASYPLSKDESKVYIRFNSQYTIGNYKVVFVAKDAYNNATEDIFVINLIDDNKPIINVKINGNDIENESSNQFAWGSNVEILVSANDEYYGNLDSKIEKKIKFGGKNVSKVDSSVNGDYLVEVTVKDDSNNVATFTFTVTIKKDEIPPVINKVLVNDVELIKDGITRVNSSRLKIVVEATDDSVNEVSSKIVIDDTYSMNSGDAISIESGLSGQLYQVRVISKDAAGNETILNYNIMIDNVSPDVGGIENNQVYTGSVSIFVYDDNIKEIKIYRNNMTYQEHTINVQNVELSQEGMYRVVAQDTYGNITTKMFALIGDNYFNIMESDNTANTYNYDYSSLIEASVNGNVISFKLESNDDISNKDRIYILVKYPNSDYKYVAYSMNGETYLNNNSIAIDHIIIEGKDNVDLLEKVDDKYYGYMMVVKDSNSGANDQGGEGSSSSGNTLKYIGMVMFGIAGAVIVFILIIKFKRRVRAV